MIAWWSWTLVSSTIAAARRAAGARAARRRTARTSATSASAANSAGSSRHDVGRQVARVGARIREHLVPLVERLRELERARRREAEPPVRRALQRRQIEQQRRRLAHRARADPLDAGRRSPQRRACSRATIASASAAVPSRATRAVPPARGEPLARRRCGTSPRTSQYGRGTNARIACSRATSIASVGVCTRPIEYSAVVAGLAAARGDRARRVHPDEPVRLRARARRVRRAASSCAARPQRREAAADRLVGERRDPQPPHRRPAARVLVDVAEDQLALAPGIARVDDRREPPVAQQPRHRAELRRRVLRRPQPELRRQHRQRLEPPRSSSARRTRPARRARRGARRTT